METPDLAKAQETYKTAVDEWINSIREEENLASVHPTLTTVDAWEQARFREEEKERRVLEAKKTYEEAVRRILFGF